MSAGAKQAPIITHEIRLEASRGLRLTEACARIADNDFQADRRPRFHGNLLRVLRRIEFRNGQLFDANEMVQMLLADVGDEEASPMSGGMTVGNDPFVRQDSIGELVDNYSRVNRKSRLPSGEYEDDVVHSVGLALDLLHIYRRKPIPNVALGRLATMSLVHDMDEIIGGDTPTLGLSLAELEAKGLADEGKVAELMARYPGLHTLKMLKAYASQRQKEARIIKIHDKTMAAYMHSVNRGRVLTEDLGLETIDAMLEAITGPTQRLAKLDQPNLAYWHNLRAEANAVHNATIYDIDIERARQQIKECFGDCGIELAPDFAVAA